MWMLLIVGVVLGLIGNVMRALAHGTGSPVDGKLVGVSAAVLTRWGPWPACPLKMLPSANGLFAVLHYLLPSVWAWASAR